MKNFIRTARKVHQSESSENGNTFVMYTMLFGLMALVFGLAIDAGMGFYTKNGLQASLDAATVSAVSSQTQYNAKGKKVINAGGAREHAVARFNESKKNYPNLITCNEKKKCSTISGTVKTAPGRGQYLSMKATVYSKNVFLHMAGMPTQQYNLTSDARIGNIQDVR